MTDIRRALAERLNAAGIPDFKCYPFAPDAVVVPCGFIQPSYPFISYGERFGQGDYVRMYDQAEACWHFWLVLLVNRIHESAAQDAVDDYIDPTGPLLAALQDEVDDALTELVGSNTTLMRGERYGAIKVGDTYYFGAVLSIEIRA
jgi:hypothetical protein